MTHKGIRARGGGGAAEAARDVELAAVRPEEQRQV